MPKYFPGKLKPEFKAKWVAALRSGEYVQGKGSLFMPASALLNKFDKDCYCCLGVGAKAAGLSYYQEGADGEYARSLGLPNHDEMLVYWWVRKPNKPMDVDSPRVMFRGKWRRLTELNDDLNVPFTEIADLIEAQL